MANYLHPFLTAQNSSQFSASTTLLIQILPPILLSVANMFEAAYIKFETYLIAYVSSNWQPNHFDSALHKLN